MNDRNAGMVRGVMARVAATKTAKRLMISGRCSEVDEAASWITGCEWYAALMRRPPYGT